MDTEAELGRGLAVLHRVTHSTFGALDEGPLGIAHKAATQTVGDGVGEVVTNGVNNMFAGKGFFDNAGGAFLAGAGGSIVGQGSEAVLKSAKGKPSTR